MLPVFGRRLFFALAGWLAVCLPPALLSASHADWKHLTPAARLEEITRAQVWQPTDVSAMDLRIGPQGEDAFEPGETVPCDHVSRKLGGHTPKFACVVSPDDEVKVKYRRDNGEVYAEVATTRLFWALGFGADRMYPVRVICHGCPFNARGEYRGSSTQILFDPATIERKMPGRTLETRPDSGWSWQELDLVDQNRGGAPRAHRDALKLLAVFVQHTDSKPAQQKIICLSEEDETTACSRPFMLVTDLGQTFGHANRFNLNSEGSVNLEEWTSEAVWKDPGQCIGNLPKSLTGTLDNPRISEEGRQFLADLLMQLSDAQLHDLFEVARFPERWLNPRRAGTVDDWVNAFKAKRDQIVQQRCPA